MENGGEGIQPRWLAELVLESHGIVFGLSIGQL